MVSTLRRLVCLAILITAVGPAHAAVYRWVDDNGTPHFSDRPEDVPARFRDQLQNPDDHFSDAPRINVMPGLNGAPAPQGEPGADGGAATLPSPSNPISGWLENSGPWMIGAMVGIGLVVLLIACALGAVFLSVACRICREEAPGFLRAMAIVGAQSLAAASLGGVLGLVLGAGLVTQGGAFGLNLLSSAGILRGMHSEAYSKALVVTLVANVVSVIFVVALIALAVFAGVGSGWVGSLR